MRTVVLGAAVVLIAGCKTPPSSPPAPPMLGQYRSSGESHTVAKHASSAHEPTTIDLRVRGMACPLCATNVKKSLARVEGVESSDVNLRGGVVHVHPAAGAEPDAAALREAVAAAGFSVDESAGAAQ